MPGYLENQDKLKAAGIDEVIIYCVNDGAVMQAWAKDQGTEGSLITMMGDPTGAFTNFLGLELNHPGPQGKGLLRRCKRHALYVVDGVIKIKRVSERGPAGQEDPAGDDFPEATLAEAMLEAIAALPNDEL